MKYRNRIPELGTTISGFGDNKNKTRGSQEPVSFGISFSKFPVSRHLLKLFYDELHSFSTFFALNFDKKLAVE
jgi:hypothetical protein